MNIETTGTVLRSLTRTRAGDRTESASWGIVYAVHAGEQGWIALDVKDAELAALLGAVIVKIEEDPKPPTTKERYAAAVKAIRKSGVAIRQNVQACCPGCAEPFKATKNFDAETTPYAWNFGGQGDALKWAGNGDKALLTDGYLGYGGAERSSVTVYFNHGNGSAERIVEAFRAEGFDVKWDGEQHSCVEVTVPARVRSRWER